MKHWLAVLFMLVFPTTVSAYDKAEEILWACNGDESKTPEAAFEEIHCIGYISGVLDGIQLVFGVRPEFKFFCPPESGISSDQQVRIVTKWLEDNPKELHKSARMSVLMAFAKAFPCE